MELPAEFTDRMRRLLGDEYDDFAIALLSEPQTSLRLNPAKCNGRPDYQPVSWCRDAYYIETRPAFTFDPRLHGGVYYVQEASSMFLDYVLRRFVDTPVRYLDLCAAPGGKSTLALSALPAGSLVVCNEVVRNRTHILAENVIKWGYDNTIVTRNTAADFGKLHHYFDVILVDAPCSGEGMFRKDTDSTGEWSIANVELCAGRGRRIIHDVWNALKPGGLLIYSTCTYNTEEDEENVHHITEELEAEALSIPVKDEWQITGPLKYDHPVYRFFPHKTRGEGFFLAALRKADGETEEIRFKNKNKKEKGKIVPAVPEAARAYLSDTTSFTPEWSGSTLWMLPEPVRDVYPLLREHLRILSAGICMGEAKGKDFIPAEELALSTALRREAFPTVDLDWEDAIRYLKKEALLLPDSTEKGYVLVCHKGFPLGFAKHLGNRANNLYPQEWRIRTGYVPEKVKTFEMKV